MVKGEHHYRNRQPQRYQQTMTGDTGRIAVESEGFEYISAPVRDQIQRQHHQNRHKREYQHTHCLDNRGLTEADNTHNPDDQYQ